MKNTKDALNELAEEIRRRLILDTKTSKLVASGEFVDGWEANVVDDSILISNKSQHAGAVLDGNPISNSKHASTRHIVSWMKLKRLRPYKKLPTGATKFVKPTEQAYNRAGFAIAKGIRKYGSIKRFRKYGGKSRLIEDVYESMEKKIGVKLTEAVRMDMVNEINRIIKVQQ